jgi:signal peptidase I
MENTLLIGDRIIVNKYIYKFRKPRRQEVLVFKFPDMPSKDFIKRLVGMPGETLKIDQGCLYVDSHDNKGFIQIKEPYIKGVLEDGLKRDPATRRSLENELTLGSDEYFVMGDNRQNSEDSRFWGPLKEKYIKGKASCVYWPFSRIKKIR